MESGDNRKFVKRTGSQQAFTTSYRIPPTLPFVAEEVKTKLAMKRSNSEKKGTLYVQAMLKKRITVRSH